MKHKVLVYLVCICSVLSGWTLSAYAASFIDLGTAARFGVLAGTTVTNTGVTTVIGDLGVSPGTSITGFPPGTCTGTTHQADASAQQAQTDLTTAYNSATSQSCDTNLTGQNLGGTTLTPAVYCFDVTAGLTGTLTLDARGNANAVFVFQIGSTLTTAGDSSVVLTNSAQAKNVFWQVGSSATLGTSTQFAGSILALESITLTNGATVSGRALARNGAVTMDTNTTIIRLASFSALPSPLGVSLSWRTGSEKDTAGFHIWRSIEEDGAYTRITTNLIPATGSSIDGASYNWRDTNTEADTVYYYKLEDIDTKGTSTFHGPLVADTRVSVGPASDSYRMVSLFLKNGWNFISLPLQPKDASLSSLLSDISPAVRIIWGYDNEKKEWLKYSPSSSLFTVYSSLQNLEAGKGYWIYMAEEGVLTYASQPASLPAVKLFPGWNLIGRRGIGMKPIAPALSLLSNKWKNIWNWTDDAWRMRSAALPVPPSFPSLNDLSQGKAYWIQVAPGAGTTEWTQ